VVVRENLIGVPPVLSCVPTQTDTSEIAMQEGNRTRLLAAAAVALLIAGVCAVAYTSRGDAARSRDELLSPLQVGRYAVRAERQSGDYDSKAERQIAFATDNDNAATAERQLAAKEESRARDSAYLAADIKSRIDKILEAGRDQVRRGGRWFFRHAGQLRPRSAGGRLLENG